MIDEGDISAVHTHSREETEAAINEAREKGEAHIGGVKFVEQEERGVPSKRPAGKKKKRKKRK